MRNVISALVVSLLMVAASHAAVTQEAPRPVKDKTELSNTVKRLFSKGDCSLISAGSKSGYAPRDLAMTFRFRCQSELASVSAILDELQMEEGFTVEKVVYPGGNLDKKAPLVDVRFVVIAPAKVDG